MREHARPDFAGVVKEVKNNLKAPLADKQPIYALRFRRMKTPHATIRAAAAKATSAA